MKISDLFDLSRTAAASYLYGFENPWQALGKIAEVVREIGNNPDGGYVEISSGVWVHRTAKIAPTACICAPAVIGENTQVRHCAYVRGCAVVGKDCVVGNSTELKNVILFDGVQVPHYNYVGDSILGYKAHMGAGAITSNVKSDKSSVKFPASDGVIYLKKAGAMIGDFAEIGCNSVLAPGTVVGRGSTVYPLSFVRGAVPPYSIYKAAGNIVGKM